VYGSVSAELVTPCFPCQVTVLQPKLVLLLLLLLLLLSAANICSC
jgi:hypothetical protein